MNTLVQIVELNLRTKMKTILITFALITIAGCESTLQDQMFAMQKYYLSDMDATVVDTSVPDILKPVEPVVYGPEENPNKD